MMDLAWTGSEFGLAWDDATTEGVNFARFDSDGTAVGTSTTVSPAGVHNIKSTWTGSEYGLSMDTFEQIHFARLDAEGGTRSFIPLVMEETNVEQMVGLAWTGSEYLLVWSDLTGSSPPFA